MASRGIFVCLLAHASIALASFVNPNPVSLCSGGPSPGQTACANVPGSCCTNGECCAGGCCPLTAVCINKGRGDEGCCPIDDATTCGRVLPVRVSRGRHRAQLTVYLDLILLQRLPRAIGDLYRS